jgi:hypothetical protein
MSVSPLLLTIAQLAPILDLSLDPTCIVDEQNRIVYANIQLKSFIGLKVKHLKSPPVLCDHIKLAACEKSCQLLASVRKSKRLELDEVPAVRGGERLRIWLRANPLFAPGIPRTAGAVGMLVVMRNTTAELVLQAKYHKVLEILKEREERIGDLERRVASLQDSIRKARERFGG